MERGLLEPTAGYDLSLSCDTWKAVEFISEADKALLLLDSMRGEIGPFNVPFTAIGEGDVDELE